MQGVVCVAVNFTDINTLHMIERLTYSLLKTHLIKVTLLINKHKTEGYLDMIDIDVKLAVQTELKLYLTQQLHTKGYLSDEMVTHAMELILDEAKKSKEAKNLTPSDSCAYL